MRIAVLSGKGGTGKTFVSVNLASVLVNSTYVDCDVEEPNGELFLNPQITSNKEVSVDIPSFLKENCNGCKKCVELCAFNALAYVKEKPMVFAEVCHSCGGCKIVCENDAVVEVKKKIGDILKGTSIKEGIDGVSKVSFISGVVNIGEVSGISIIRQMLDDIIDDTDTVIDCPPGSGCMVMECIKEADYCIIVAEPTEFGKHNLSMVCDLVKVFNKPFGVVLNKCIDGINPSGEFCKDNNIDIIASIPFEKTVGKENADAKIVVNYNREFYNIFNNLGKNLKKVVTR